MTNNEIENLVEILHCFIKSIIHDEVTYKYNDLGNYAEVKECKAELIETLKNLKSKL